MEEETTADVVGEHAQVVVDADAVGAGDLGHETIEVAEVAMPQLDPAIYPNLIFWLVLALIALYLILSKIALPRVGTILAERNDAISNDLEEAALFNRRAKDAEAGYNAALAGAREEAQKIGAEAKEQVNKELASLMAKADAEIAARTAESENRIREIEESAASSVEEVAKAVAFDIVAAMGPRAADQQAVDAAVNARLGG